MNKKRILLCEDESDLLEGLSFTLTRKYEDREIIIAKSGKEAIYLLAEGLYDICICDYMMRNGSGGDVHEWLKKNPAHFPKKFIFFTAHMEMLKIQSSEIEVVLKPDYKKLVRIVNDFLDQ